MSEETKNMLEKVKEKFVKQHGVTFTGEDDWIPPYKVWEFIEQEFSETIKQAKIEEDEQWIKYMEENECYIDDTELFEDRINELKRR